MNFQEQQLGNSRNAKLAVGTFSKCELQSSIPMHELYRLVIFNHKCKNNPKGMFLKHSFISVISEITDWKQALGRYFCKPLNL